MAHPLFGPEIRMMLIEDNRPGLKAFCETLRPSTVAETLGDGDFTVEEVWKVLEETGIRDQAAVFEYFPTSWQVKMVEGAGRQRVAKLIEQMSHDDRVDLLRRLDPRVADGLLRLVDEADRKDIAELFRYGENTVGALMTTDYAWLPENLTAGQAIDRLRQQAPDKETIYYIFILEETSRRLVGVVSLRDLILTDRFQLIREIVEQDLIVVKVTDDREAAAELLAKYDFLAIPVIDEEKRLVGIITADDVIDVIQDEATEDLQRQAAVGPIRESYFEASHLKVWRSRAGWLAALFVAQMGTLTAIQTYQGEIEKILVLSIFMPLCISVGGNAGSQTATLITRALALEQVRIADWYLILRREILIGLMLAASVGILGLLRTYFLTSDRVLGGASLEHLTWVIGLSVTAICLWGTLIGSMLPLIFKKLGVDPAIASSPFIATLCDISGIFIYFNVARIYFF